MALAWQGLAMALPWLLPALLPGIAAPGKVAKGRRWSCSQAPLLPTGRGLPAADKGEKKPARTPMPSLDHRQGLEARGCLWLTASAGSCGAGQGVPGEGWACQMCMHSWGDGMPVSLSCSQPLSSYFNPKDGPSVPPEPLLHIGGVGVAAQRSGAFSDGFDWFFYTSAFCIFLHQKRERAGPCCGLFTSPLGAACSVPWRPGSSQEHLQSHWLVCRESNQPHGRVGVSASSTPTFSLGFPHPSWQEGIGHR